MGMRLAFILTQSLDSPSGLGRFGPLAREMVSLGHEVDLFALHYDYKSLEKRRFLDSGVRVSYVGQMHVRKVGPRKLYFSPSKLLYVSLTSTLQLARALYHSKADLIQLCKPQPMNVAAVNLGRRGRPVFCDSDDNEITSNRFSGRFGLGQRSIVGHFESDVVRYARGITTNTRFTERFILDLGYPPDRLIYVPNGVDRRRFGQIPDGDALRARLGIRLDEQIVGYVGTLSVHGHAIDLLLKAFALLAPRNPKARLLLVGGGDDYDAVTSELARLGIADRTILTGRVDPDEIPGYLRLCSLTVDATEDNPAAASRSPLKIVESLAVGVPVVTGDIGDRRETLGAGKFGRLVTPGDAQSLADGIASLLDNGMERAEMGRLALATRETLFWDSRARDFARVYELPDRSPHRRKRAG